MKKEIGTRPILFPAPVMIVGSYDKDGKPNAMNSGWGGIVCGMPPCVSISLRKATYSHGNIMETKAFTVNIPSKNHVCEADYFGMVSGRDADKFEVTKLTPVKSELVNAPYIEEFPIALECKVIAVNELGSHTQFVGEIVGVKVDDELSVKIIRSPQDALNADDNQQAMIEQVMPLIFDMGDFNYYTIGEKVGKAFGSGKELVAKS